MLSERKLLSIAIPTWNRIHYLSELVEELTSEITKYNLASEIEIVISDNASNDGTDEFLKSIHNKFDFVNIFRNASNLGAKTNVILSLKRSLANYIILLGDDDRIRKGALQDIIKELKNDSNISIIIDTARYKNCDLNFSHTNLENLVKKYYWYMGNAGCFIMSSQNVSNLIDKFGISFFNECWPQTQIMLLNHTNHANKIILLKHLSIIDNSKHDNAMSYTSYYLWRTCVLELHHAIDSIAPYLQDKLIYAAKTFMISSAKQNFYNILQCAIFVDDYPSYIKTRCSIHSNLNILTNIENLWFYSVYIILCIPRFISRIISNFVILLIRGKAGYQKKNEFVKKELNKAELIKLKSTMVRRLDWEQHK